MTSLARLGGLFAATLVLATPVLAQDAAVLKRGQTLTMQCKVCHTFKPGEPNRVGPNLGGIIGADSATRKGYTNYSPGLKAAKLKWTDANLDKYLTSPAKMIKGSRMAFAGIAKPEDRAAVIAWLKVNTK